LFNARIEDVSPCLKLEIALSRIVAVILVLLLLNRRAVPHTRKPYPRPSALLLVRAG
jgi:hypothetical protein